MLGNGSDGIKGGKEMKEKHKKIALEFLHYILLFGLIMMAWSYFMDAFGTDIPKIATATFIIFVLGDLVLHKYLLGE